MDFVILICTDIVNLYCISKSLSYFSDTNIRGFDTL